MRRASPGIPRAARSGRTIVALLFALFALQGQGCVHTVSRPGTAARPDDDIATRALRGDEHDYFVRSYPSHLRAELSRPSAIEGAN